MTWALRKRERQERFSQLVLLGFLTEEKADCGSVCVETLLANRPSELQSWYIKN